MTSEEAVPVEAEGDEKGITIEKRDRDIFRMIYDCGGMVASRQVYALFWPGKTPRSPQRRLEKLWKFGYIARPPEEELKKHPEAKGTYCLGWKGAVWVARGTDVPWAETADKKKQNQLQRELSEAGFYWQLGPNWQQVEHDLAIGDCYLAVAQLTAPVWYQSLKSQPDLQLVAWMPEMEFRAKASEQRALPDAYFVLHDQKRGLAAQFLLEVDRGNHPYAEVSRKLSEEVAFWQSDQYRTLSGSDQSAGRWVWVCKDQKRMRKIMAELVPAAAKEDAKLFWFTTIDQVRNQNILTTPIWYKAGQESPQTLLEDKQAKVAQSTR